ncbi:MBL fold metallo-hydrolase [Bacteroidota bacterium]
MVDISEVAENIFLIDNEVYSMPRSGSVYLINEDKKALVEVGPPSSVNRVLDGIKAAGVDPADVDYIIVTHIHLDHSGGAGVLLNYMPKAKVVVHHRGVRHLVNPQRLISSMRKVQGEDFWAKVGDVEAVPPERILAVHNNDTIELSRQQTLRIIAAPGHSPNHICIFETRHGGLFSGEAAGSLLADGKLLLPVNTPTAFDLEQYVATIKKLMKLNPSMLYHSHFGVTSAVQDNFKQAMEKALIWDDIVTAALSENKPESAPGRMIDRFRDEIELTRENKPLYDYFTSNMQVYAAAYIKYHEDKQRKEASGLRKERG